MDGPADSADIFAFLETLRPSDDAGAVAMFDALYACPWTVLAVLQSLPPLAKQVVMRLALIPAPVDLSVILSWVRTPEQAKEALDKLRRLHVTRVEAAGDAADAASLLGLSAPFREQLLLHLSSGEQDVKPWPVVAVEVPLKPAFVEQLAMKEWSSILHFLASSSHRATNPELVTLLQKAGLLEFRSTVVADAGGGAARTKIAMTITPAGYRFMLKDVHVQLWTFVSSYISIHLTEMSDKIGLLSLLFQLSFCVPGDVFAFDEVGPAAQVRLRTLASFGLVVIADDEFYPSSLAVQLTRGQSADVTLPAGPAVTTQLIVEPTFTVIAFNPTQLTVSLLALFTKIETILPNIMVGIITRNSVAAGFDKGINAAHIEHFLGQHLSRERLGMHPVLPKNVRDQLWHWEHERNRIVVHSAWVVEDFASSDDYAEFEKWARETGVCLFSSAEKLMVVCPMESVPQVKSFFEQRKRRR